MKIYFFQTLALLTCLSLFTGCNKTPPVQPSGKVIKIGIIAPLSGSGLNKGKEGIKGIKYILNTAPLLDNGDKIELYIKDDRNDPAQSINALKNLATKEKVNAVLSFSGSHAVLGLAKVADTYKTPVLSLLATNPGITQNNKYVTQLGFNDHFQGIAAALFVHDELLINRVAVFKNSKNIYSSELANTFKQKFESIRGQVILDSDFIDDNKKLNKTLLEIRNKKVQLVYSPVNTEQVMRIMNALNKLEWYPKIMGADGLLVSMLTHYKNDLSKLDGILATDFYSNNIKMTDIGLEIKTGYEAKNGDLTSYSMMGIEGINLLKRLINQCPAPLSNQCIQDQLNSAITYTGLLGIISLNSARTAERVLFINEIDDGKLNYIVQIY